MKLMSILIYLIWLGISALQIGWVAVLKKRYDCRFLSYYFYVIILSNLYGFLNFNGKSLVADLLEGGIEGVLGNQIITLVAVPFLIISFYILMLFFAEVRSSSVSSYMKAGYWIFQAVIMTIFIILVIRLSAVQTIDPILPYFYIISFSQAVLITGIYLYNAVAGRKITNRIRRDFLFVFILVEFIGFVVLIYFAEYARLPFYYNAFQYYIFNSALFLTANFLSIGVLTYFIKKYTFAFVLSSELSTDFRFQIREYRITDREREIIQLVMKGMTNREISNELFISDKTVKNNLTSIYRKTGTRNRVELTNLFG